MGEEEQEQHDTTGWRFVMESSGELDVLPHHSSK